MTMLEPPMPESVARAICCSGGCQAPDKCDWRDWQGEATAVLQTLIEPTPEMVSAGLSATALGEASLYDEDVAAIFTAMITAALGGVGG